MVPLRTFTIPCTCSNYCLLLAGGELGVPPSSDTRAELMLDMMLGTLLAGSEPPTLAHLLLGFDTSSPPLHWHESSYLEPEHELSCLSVLLKALQVS
jgi:hypothetical protein